jgi:type II secretory pathway pseudopilin PulG
MKPSRRAFTLIEVVLAMGVLTFAVLMLLALVPAGLQTNRDTREESMATNLIAAMIADWRAIGVTTNASTVFKFPHLNTGAGSTNTLWIGESGQSVVAASARYRVAYRLTPPPSGSCLPYYVDFTVSWPAQATNAVSKVEAIAALPSL